MCAIYVPYVCTISLPLSLTGNKHAKKQDQPKKIDEKLRTGKLRSARAELILQDY